MAFPLLAATVLSSAAAGKGGAPGGGGGLGLSDTTKQTQEISLSTGGNVYIAGGNKNLMVMGFALAALLALLLMVRR